MATDPVIKPQVDGGSPVAELSELQAHKELHKMPPIVQEPVAVREPLETVAEPDLANASITGIQVERLSARPERRTTRPLPRAPRPITASEILEKQENSRAAAKRPKPIGILSNPHFRYTGGPFSRVITFFANLLKFLEQLGLRMLGAGRAAPTTPALKRQSTLNEQQTTDQTLQQPKSKRPAGKGGAGFQQR